ncbi:MAG: alpha-mannosidase [Eubacteriales bacterium]|nr:alpha-mannosidase [Eubacteriales bacterium]
MKVKDPHFVLEKIEKYVQEDIRPSRIREALELSEWRYLETDMEERIDDAYTVEYDDSSWKPFRLWDTWGGYDRVAWFRTRVRIPEKLRGKTLALRLLPGPRDGGESTAEGLLYVNGHPVQAVDIWHEEVLLEEALCRESELCLALKVWSGVLNPPKFRTFREAKLIELDMRVDKFCFLVDTLRRCALLLDESDLRRIRLTRLLNDTFRRVNFLDYGGQTYYDSIYGALSFLQEELSALEQVEEIKPTVYGVGHSHIDMAWLWRLSATREKASRTFSTVLNLMRQYPEYRFMHSSPQLYRFVKQDYPEIYEQIREKIREGQWEITGGMWVEPDTNIPSGESLVRQFLYGKRFIREEFGKETTLVWLPDVFGYSAAFPQIMKKCGMKYFMTTKISWNQYNHFPYDTFWWKGIDGTEIFTHFITTPEDGSWFYTYNGHMDPEEVTGVWKNYKDKDKNDELLIAFGWGDGGGGPTREMLEQSRVMKNVPGIPRVKITSAEDYFARIYDHADHQAMGTWEGELYFELHRGTYTSQAANKRYNRQTETLLHNIEFLWALGGGPAGSADYPKESLDRMWERTLLNQFHDILPGSSIRQVYEDTTKDYEAIRKEGEALLLQAAGRIGQDVRVDRDSVIFYNTAGFERDSYLMLPYGDQLQPGSLLEDEAGVLDSADTPEGLLVRARKLPPYGYRTARLSLPGEKAGKALPAAVSVSADGAHIESPYYTLDLNENGEIAGLYDRQNGRRVDGGSPMNVFAAFEDKPQRFDAWDVDVYYKEKPYAPFTLTDRRVLQEGERAVIRQTWSFHESSLTQELILYANDRRIDFVTELDWKEKQVFLKAYFPVAVHAPEASYEIQFGSVKRPTHTNTEWDFARFEVPAHRWADLSESGYGVALLNDCKYGYDIHKNVIGLSLLKSAVRPDETADRRLHRFTYALYPHAGSLEESDVQRAAVDLNLPVLTGFVPKTKGAAAFSSFSLASVSASSHVQLDTIKRSEDGRGLVLRLFEYQNRAEQNVQLKLGFPAERAYECNLCEEELRPVSLAEGELSFDIGCFEIKTFLIL